MAYYTRGYYSANSNVYEGYYKGPSQSGPLANIKYAIVTFAYMASANKSFAGIRTALVTSTSLILPQRVNQFSRIVNALATNLAKDINLAYHKRLAAAINVSLASTKKSRFTNVSVILANLANFTKLSRFKRNSAATVSNLAKVRTRATFIKVASALVTNLAFEGKESVFNRYSFAQMTLLTTNTKHATFIRVARIMATNLANDIRIALHKRLARVTSIQMARTQKNRSTNILVITTNLVRSIKITRLIKRATTTVTNLAIAIRRASIIRTARVITANLANDVRIALHKRLAYAISISLVNSKRGKFASVRVTFANLAKTTRLSRFNRKSTATVSNLAIGVKRVSKIRVARVLVANLATDIKVVLRKRVAAVIAISLTKTTRGRKTSIKVTSTNVVKVSRIARLIRRSTANVTRLVSVVRNRKVSKNAIAMQTVMASVTRVKGAHRVSNVTMTYQIGTTKSKTLFRKAIATTAGLIRYGVNRVMNVRSVENAQVQPINEINFYVTPNNVDVVGEYTAENDLPGDYAEPSNNLGEDVVPT